MQHDINMAAIATHFNRLADKPNFFSTIILFSVYTIIYLILQIFSYYPPAVSLLIHESELGFTGQNQASQVSFHLVTRIPFVQFVNRRSLPFCFSGSFLPSDDALNQARQIHEYMENRKPTSPYSY